METIPKKITRTKKRTIFIVKTSLPVSTTMHSHLCADKPPRLVTRRSIQPGHPSMTTR